MKWEGISMVIDVFNRLRVGDIVSSEEGLKIITEVVELEKHPGQTAYLKVRDFCYEEILPEELR